MAPEGIVTLKVTGLGVADVLYPIGFAPITFSEDSKVPLSLKSIQISASWYALDAVPKDNVPA